MSIPTRVIKAGSRVAAKAALEREKAVKPGWTPEIEEAWVDAHRHGYEAIVEALWPFFLATMKEMR